MVSSAPFLLLLVWPLHSICEFSKGNGRLNNRSALLFHFKIKWKPCDELCCFTFGCSSGCPGFRAGDRFPSQRVFRTNRQHTYKREMVGYGPRQREKAMTVTKGTDTIFYLPVFLRACRPLFSLQSDYTKDFKYRWKLSSPQPFPGTLPRLPK